MGQLKVGDIRREIRGLPDDSVVFVQTPEFEPEADPDGIMVDTAIKAIRATPDHAKSTLVIETE